MRWAIFLTIVIIAGVFFWIYGGSEITEIAPNVIKQVTAKYVTAEINHVKIKAEIAKSDTARAAGLSNRNTLGENTGMVFVFEKPGEYAFWMKDMLFGIDIIWINNDKVVDISKNVLPEKGPEYTRYKAKAPIDTVIEVEAGYCEKNGIKIGQAVTYSQSLR